LAVALQLYLSDRATCPAAYDPAVFYSANPLKCASCASPSTAILSVPSSPASVQACVASRTLSAPRSNFISSYPLHSLLTNLPVRFRPSPSLPIDDPSLEPTSTACTGSHLLLSNRTVAWLSITPQLGTVPFAFNSHSHLFPVASAIIQPVSFPSTPLCYAAPRFLLRSACPSPTIPPSFSPPNSCCLRPLQLGPHLELVL
jgi:hypothetical protein